MAIREINFATLFEVGKDNDDRPVYNHMLHQEVRPGTSAAQIIQDAKAWQPSAAQPPHGHGGRPERYLDIDEKRSGVCLYIFRMNVEYGGQQRLLFVSGDDRFIKLPLNSSTEEDPIEDVKINGGDRQYGAFSVDIDGLRQTELAKRVKALAHPHVKVLRIPFYFNVEDPVLEAAPWVLSDHSGTHSHYYTHGGVHPLPAALLSVEI